MPSSPSTMEAGGQNVGGQVVIEHRHPFMDTNDYFFDFGFLLRVIARALESRVTLFLALALGGEMGS